MRGRLYLDTRSGYDRWSTIYDDELNPLVLLEEPVVRGWLAHPTELRVADVGCGTGRHALWLAQAGAFVDAYDLSAGMLARARDKLVGLTVRLHQHALPDPIPAEDGTYDVTLLSLVADHLADLERAFRELRRVTRPGGQVVFTVLHPAMNLLGITARFTDPADGREVRVAAYEHTYADYLMGVLRAGLVIEEVVERKAEAELTAKTPRAEKYLGWPMLLAMRLQRGQKGKGQRKGGTEQPRCGGGRTVTEPGRMKACGRSATRHPAVAQRLHADGAFRGHNGIRSRIPGEDRHVRKRRIVVVEDEPAILQGLLDVLEASGYEPVGASDGETGLDLSRRAGVELVLLDLLLPRMDGLSVLAELRKTHSTLPVIILTARGAEEDRVRGLRGGADDYVVKPFSARELLARVEAVLRRSPERPLPVKAIKSAAGTVDFDRSEIVFTNGQRAGLSEMEAAVLVHLAANPGRVVSRDELLMRVWGIGGSSVETRAIDMHITRLRSKLRPPEAGEAPEWIVTVRGKGYMLGPEVILVTAERSATG